MAKYLTYLLFFSALLLINNTQALLWEYEPEEYFTGMMIGLQKDTYSNTTCPTSSVKLKNIIVTAEYIVYTVF